ncbi:MAG TPA: hypothetical protein VMQ67_00265, partial [Candidatus Saccharimonadales bacterium]|nr:hypothetical protein [Candidatus Saccharimonadales bacterium]
GGEGPPLHVAGAAQITDGHQLTVVALASTTSTFNPGLLVNQTFPDLSPPHLDGIPIPNTWSADELHVPLGIFSGSAVGEKRPIVNIDPFFSFYNFLSPSVGVDGMDKANPGLFTVGVNARGYIYFGQ